MFNVTNLIHVESAGRDALLADLRGIADRCGARTSLIGPTLPGARNGGDVLMHLRFDDDDGWRHAEPRFAAALSHPAVSRVDGVRYPGTPDVAAVPGSTVYRALLLRVAPGTSDELVARFEADLAAMPRYVSTIRAWQLGRVTEAVGATAWTHVFEQEFTDVEGLMGPYLMHPIHWAVVDRWFDPETTDLIIRDRVCHSFCAITEPVLN